MAGFPTGGRAVSDGKFELLVTGGISGIVGAVVTAGSMIFKMGRRDRDVDELRKDVDDLDGRMEQVESAMADGRVSSVRIETKMDHLESHVSELKTEMKGVNARLDKIFGDMGRRSRLTESDVKDLFRPQPGGGK